MLSKNLPAKEREKRESSSFFAPLRMFRGPFLKFPARFSRQAKFPRKTNFES
jgi:hypothetical protein